VKNHFRRVRVLSRIGILFACVFFMSSCHRPQPPVAKHYPFTGRVLTIDIQNQSAVADGDNVPGFMDPMTMSYKIKPPATLSQLSPGDSIAADLMVEPENENGYSLSWLENVKVTAHSKLPAPAGPLHMPTPREDVPDFSFTNQSGKKISLSQYRGKVLIVTFIYTRCPFADFCPRVSDNFAQINQQFAIDSSLAPVRLLSVSFDPDHDTPKVLRDYGFSVAHTHDPQLFARWEFAAPATKDLPKVAGFFGLMYKSENGLITHNLSTAVIGPDGKIVEWYHGGDWQISDVVHRAANAARGSP
jgi:protein SCO1